MASANGGRSSPRSTPARRLDYDQSYWLMDQVMSGELGDARLASFLTAMAIKGATVDGDPRPGGRHGGPRSPPSTCPAAPSTSSARAATATRPSTSRRCRRSCWPRWESRSSSTATVPPPPVGFSRRHRGAGGQPGRRYRPTLRSIFEEVGIAFLFANKMHPSMRFAAPVRRALGFPTAFNVLGPLTNPAKVRACAVGSAKEDNARLMAGVYASRGCSALVFRGATTGLDELTTADTNQVWIGVGWPGDAHRFRCARRARHGSGRDRRPGRRGGVVQRCGGPRCPLGWGSLRRARCGRPERGGWHCGLGGPGSARDRAGFTPRMRCAVERALGALADGAGARLVDRWAHASNS